MRYSFALTMLIMGACLGGYALAEGRWWWAALDALLVVFWALMLRLDIKRDISRARNTYYGDGIGEDA